MFTVIVTAVIIGVNAGLSPGPLLSLVIVETAKNGYWSGIKVAMAPLITDIPIVAASFFILGSASSSNELILIIGLIGGVVLLYFGYKDLTSVVYIANPSTITSNGAFRKGVVTNATNPSPYIFWLTVFPPLTIGQPTSIKLAFICAFLITIVLTKVLVAWLLGRYMNNYLTRHLLYVVRTSGMALILFGLLIIKQAMSELFI